MRYYVLDELEQPVAGFARATDALTYARENEPIPFTWKIETGARARQMGRIAA